MKNSDFYNDLSSNYDEMINFEESLNNKINLLRKYIKPKYKSALDLGCGTGADSIALSKIGLSVDAIDHSSGMLEKAKNNSLIFDVNISFFQSSLSEINITKQYDFIVSLGNTIANITPDELEIIIKKISELLKNNGKALIQIINYAKLPQSGVHILNRFENETKSIIRKYVIQQNYIDFIIEQKSKTINEKSEIVTKLFPHSVSDFRTFAENNNLRINYFGSLKKDEFLSDLSNNLVLEIFK